MTSKSTDVDDAIIKYMEELYEFVARATEKEATPERYGVLNSLRLTLDQGRKASLLLRDQRVIGEAA